MSKRTILGFFMILAFALSLCSFAMAGNEPTGVKSETPKAKTMTGQMPGHGMKMAANEVAVCGCGKVFAPDATTKYLEYDGKSYACCTEGCHAMAMKDPAAAAKMAEENTAKLLNPPAAKKY